MKKIGLLAAALVLMAWQTTPVGAQSSSGDSKDKERADRDGMRGISGGQTREFKYKVPGTPEQYTLKISNLQADISIEAYSGTEIVLTAMDYEGIPEKAQGLKPLSATGPDNTDIGLNIKTEGNVILLAGAGRHADEADYVIRVPSAMGIAYEQESWHGGGDFIVTGINGEINLQMKNSDIILKDVSGPVVANTVSGDVTVEFSKINQTKPSSLAATSGDIDIKLPSDARINFKLSVVSGEVYTDMDLKFSEKEGLSRMGGMNANPTFNGGGVEMSLRAISGDIYLRKK